MTIRNLPYQIRSIADRSKRYSERHFKIFGVIAVFVVPATTLIERAVAEPAFDTLSIRLSAGLVGLLLLFHDKLPGVLQKNLEYVWVLSITFILPFCYGAILTLNAALADPGTSPSPIWVYQYLVALFIYIQLVNHGPLSLVLWLLSTIAIFALALALTNPNYAALAQVWIYPLPVYLTALVIGSITNRNVHIVQSEQLRAASAIGSNIAHELRTPLASIRALARGIGRFLPILVDGYEKAKSQGHQVQPIADNQLEQLRLGLTAIREEVDYSNTIIDMLLVNTSERPVTNHQFQQFKISEAAGEAVARFPFNNSNERRLIRFSFEEDFVVSGPRILVVHVFFNLIKNGLYFVQRGGKGLLTLTAKVKDQRNVVEITDTGTGISESLQPRIFDRFFTAADTGQGAGIGLSFCKMVMESIGGEIQCESREGEYTTFRLIFPAVSDRETSHLAN